MGRLENSSENTQADQALDQAPDRALGRADSDSPADVLRSVTQDLRTLQQDLVAQMQQDVRRLQAEKSRLLNDIEKLQQQQQVMQSQYEVALSQQQLAQQQAWAKQMALALANHLHTALTERLSQTLSARQIDGVAMPQLPAHADQTDRLVASVDDTVNRAFTALRHDLNSYQSALSQQIGRMQDLGQQGEALLEVLVGRISQYLQLEATKPRSDRPARFEERRSELAAEPLPKASFPPPAANPPLPASPAEPEALAPLPPAAAPSARSRSARLSQFQLGLMLVLFSALALALHNVVVFIAGNSSNLFGSIPIGGYIKLNLFRNALLLLEIRTLVIVPLMVLLAKRLYPLVWRDIQHLSQSNDRRILGSVIVSGFFMFLSQAFLYVAINQLGPSVAVTLLFAYPILTIPLMAVLFGDRPTRLRLVTILIILVGGGLAAYPELINETAASKLGLFAALASGVSFSFYLVAMQISFRKLHPVPISLIQFATMFVFTSLGLMVLGVNLATVKWVGLAGSGVLLGVLTMVGYFLNDAGIRSLGAARAATIAASVPALTALLAFAISPSSLTTLDGNQIVGVLAVTLAGLTLGLERLLILAKTNNRKAAQRTVQTSQPQG